MLMESSLFFDCGSAGDVTPGLSPVDCGILAGQFTAFPTMSPTARRVLQALLYEAIAIAVVGPLLSLAFNKSPASTFGLAVVLSCIALMWNYTFNWLFERWESRQPVRGRSFARRLAHGAGFEGGLVVILLPVMSLWLDISLVTALVTNLGLLAFFFFYAIAFTWCFDRVFGLPASAQAGDAGRD
jgi:uncharacterized membrane protein